MKICTGNSAERSDCFLHDDCRCDFHDHKKPCPECSVMDYRLPRCEHDMIASACPCCLTGKSIDELGMMEASYLVAYFRERFIDSETTNKELRSRIEQQDEELRHLRRRIEANTHGVDASQERGCEETKGACLGMCCMSREGTEEVE